MILEEDQIDLNEPPINFKTMLLIDNSTKLNEDNDNLKIQIEVCNICFLTNILKMLNLELLLLKNLYILKVIFLSFFLMKYHNLH